MQEGIYNKVTFHGNGIIQYNCTFDTLVFTPGYSYNLLANHTFTVNKYFDSRGNSCFPIFIQSTNKESPAMISKSDGIISCDFMSITDIHAVGGATFYAGSYTTAIGNNNRGWIYENSPGYIYGFGADTVMCEGDILNTFNFNGAKSYLWHDGSTKSYYTADETGLYWVIVTYADNCKFSDSIYVEIISNAFVNAGKDQVVCKPNTPIQARATIKDGIAPYEISWTPWRGIDNPFSENITISTDRTTEYILNVKSANGCFARDTIRYIVIEDFQPQIARDGLYLVSNSTVGNQWYLNGEKIVGATQQRYLPFITGVYTVAIVDEFGCKSEASQPIYFHETDLNLPTFIVKSAEAETGDIVEIPIYLTNKRNLISAGINSLSTELYFNPSVLYPIDNKYVKANNSAFISINNISINQDIDKPIAVVRFQVGLGNEEHSDLWLDNIELHGGETEYLVLNGTFSLLDICRAGGNRLLNPFAVADIINIVPNPASNTVHIAVSLSEIGLTEMKIYNLLGEEIRLVLSENVSSTGMRDISVDISELPNGQYYIILSTPTHRKMQKLIINK